MSGEHFLSHVGELWGIWLDWRRFRFDIERSEASTAPPLAKEDENQENENYGARHAPDLM